MIDKKLAFLEAEIIIKRYAECNYSKAATTKSLGISRRGFDLRFNRIIQDFPELYEMLKQSTPKQDEHYCSCFPTNEFRIEYRDKGF